MIKFEVSNNEHLYIETDRCVQVFYTTEEELTVLAKMLWQRYGTVDWI